MGITNFPPLPTIIISFWRVNEAIPKLVIVAVLAPTCTSPSKSSSLKCAVTSIELSNLGRQWRIRGVYRSDGEG